MSLAKLNVSNLKKFYLAQSFAFCYFWIAISVPYFIYRGLSPTQAFLLLSLYNIVALIFEFPTGVLGDRYGHKRMLLISNFMTFFSMILLAQKAPIEIYFLALFILAIGNSLNSGNDVAILKKLSSYIKHDTANYNSLTDLILFFSALLGGFLSLHFGYTFTLYLSGVLMLCANIPLLLLHLEESSLYKINRSFGNTAIIGIKSVLSNRPLQIIILIVAFFGGFGNSVKSIFGSFGTIFGTNVWTVGILVGTCGLARAVSSKMLTKKSNFSLNRAIFWIVVTTILAGLIHNFWFVSIMLLTGQWFFGILNSAADGIIHDLAEDHVRASVFSLRRLLMRLAVSGYLPLAGYVIEKISFSVLIFSTGSIMFVIWLFSRGLITKHKLSFVNDKAGKS